MRRSALWLAIALGLGLLGVAAAANAGAAAADAGAAAGAGRAAPATAGARATATTAAAAPTAGAPAEATGESRKLAEALFARYIDLEHAFDPALVDLYADEAHVESRLIVPGQRPIVRKWTGTQYKDLLRRALEKAKATRQDLNYYTAANYLREGSRVRIKAMRYAEMQKIVSPIELLVGPDRSGSWRIYEELGESHPLTSARPARPAPRP